MLAYRVKTAAREPNKNESEVEDTSVADDETEEPLAIRQSEVLGGQDVRWRPNSACLFATQMLGSSVKNAL